MVLRLGQARGQDVADLIARKQYPRAIEIIRAQLESRRNDPRVRLQLADVLVMAGRPQEAVSILAPLADEYARDGFAAKAVAVLKRIQKIDPRRRDVEPRLAALIEQKQRQATVPIASAPARVEFGFEEIQPGLEIGIEPIEDASVPVELPPPPTAPAPPPAPVEDRDLAFGDVEEVVVEAEPVRAAGPLAGDGFTQELMAIMEDVFPTSPMDTAEAALPSGPDAANPASRQIVVSPLFRDFSVDELVAVIHGLELQCYEPGEIIISEGEPGDSLYMISAGRVKAFKRGATGKQTPLGEMSEGAFFGEISVLTGQPRSATVVAATTCELLELGRAELQRIAGTHPHVWDVLREHAERRMRGQQ